VFDDVKTSHQHIDLLKTKYIAMRREFEISKDKKNDQMIDVKGTQDIYDSQINAITSQMSTMYEKNEEYEGKIKKDLYDTEKKVKEAGKVRGTLDAEVRSYDQ
jgi:predicted  nucleic acid-binding Zn-ribbon protein